MPPEPISPASCITPGQRPASDNVRRGARLALPQAFWIGLTLATPIAGLAAWYLFGLDNLGNWKRDEWDRWLMLGSAALVVVLHVVVLAMLIAESKTTRHSPKNPSA